MKLLINDHVPSAVAIFYAPTRKQTMSILCYDEKIPLKKQASIAEISSSTIFKNGMLIQLIYPGSGSKSYVHFQCRTELNMGISAAFACGEIWKSAAGVRKGAG